MQNGRHLTPWTLTLIQVVILLVVISFWALMDFFITLKLIMISSIIIRTKKAHQNSAMNLSPKTMRTFQIRKVQNILFHFLLLLIFEEPVRNQSARLCVRVASIVAHHDELLTQ